MAITINDNSPRAQYTASSGQTNFAGTWRIEDAADIEVYQALSGVAPDDTTDILVLTTDYTVTGVGVGNSFTVVLNVGAATGDDITILANIDFSANYNFLTNQNFDPDDFNEIFSKFDRELKQLRMETRKLQPKYQNSEQVIAKDYKLPQLAANQSWRMDETNAEIEAVVLGIVGPGETWYGVTTGTDTYLVTITDFVGYTVGEIIFLQFGSSNTTASTININGLGGKTLVNTNGIAFVAGDFVAGVTYTFIFHDDKYYLLGLGQKATAAEVETGTDNFKYVTPKTLKAHTGNVFFVSTAGAANVYTGTITGLTSYYIGLTLEIKINATNTAASTLNINGLGAKGLLRADTSAAQAGDLTQNLFYIYIYDGANFNLMRASRSSIADVKAVTNNVDFITPARAIYHPGIAKAWVHFDGLGATIQKSYNVTSVTKNGTGDYTINFTNTMSDANYVVSANSELAGTPVTTQIFSSATSSVTITVANSTTGALVDPARAYAIIYGDLA